MGGLFISGGGALTINVQPQVPATNSIVNKIPSSKTETLICPTNISRKGFIIFNDSVYKMYIKLGAGVTNESFTVQLLSGMTYEMSQTILYAGEIYGIWDDIDGNAHLTELI